MKRSVEVGMIIDSEAILPIRRLESVTSFGDCVRNSVGGYRDEVSIPFISLCLLVAKVFCSAVVKSGFLLLSERF
jgi:hypothetical protein